MDKKQLRDLVRNISVWKRGSQRAPHKPLLLLYALGKCSRGEPREISFSEIDHELQGLREFGPSRKSYHPEYPFWRLQHDGLWVLGRTENLQTRESNTDPKKSELLKHNVSGGFPEWIYDRLIQDTLLIEEIAREILEQNFPSSVHEDLLDAVGMVSKLQATTRVKRDPAFRILVLTAYEYRCAVCSWDVRLGSTQLGVEAAHIKWRQAGGPDIIQNGLALCTLHHKLFDRGAFTISQESRVQVSEHAHGTSGFEEWLLAFHGEELRRPQRPDYQPGWSFLKWHHREVFRAPARYLGD